MKYMVLSWDKNDEERLESHEELKVVEGTYDNLEEAQEKFKEVKHTISNAYLVKLIDMEEHI